MPECLDKPQLVKTVFSSANPPGGATPAVTTSVSTAPPGTSKPKEVDTKLDVEDFCFWDCSRDVDVLNLVGARDLIEKEGKVFEKQLLNALKTEITNAGSEFVEDTTADELLAYLLSQASRLLTTETSSIEAPIVVMDNVNVRNVAYIHAKQDLDRAVKRAQNLEKLKQFYDASGALSATCDQATGLWRNAPFCA